MTTAFLANAILTAVDGRSGPTSSFSSLAGNISRSRNVSLNFVAIVFRQVGRSSSSMERFGK